MSNSSPDGWIADRTATFDSSGIRKVFDLAANLKDPINLSIGQPDYDVPEPVKAACIEAIQAGKNGYALTQGVTEFREKLQAKVDAEYGHGDRQVFVTSGTSGALVLAMLALVNPGDEVILFDPYFVMYEPLVSLVGGKAIVIDTYPDFAIDLDRVRESITDRTKLILLNSPGNPTGAIATEEEVAGLAQIAGENNVALISDEIYRDFTYDVPFHSPASINENTLVIDGFSKSHAMTGWRLGFAHGPKTVIETMTKLQQYSFVCAPNPVQWAGLVAMDTPTEGYSKSYQAKRDRLISALSEDYELAKPGGAFYLFPKAPWGTGTEFVEQAIENNLLIIPGNIFSKKDTHFRVSYAASDETIERGIEVLKRLARQPASSTSG
jgi:aspartate aminotransferase/aminotransferase